MILVFLFLGSLLSRIKDTQYTAKDHQPPDINYFAEILLLLACFHIYLVSLTKCIVMKNQINTHGDFIFREIKADLFYYDQQEGYICSTNSYSVLWAHIPLCGTWLTCSNLHPETGAIHLFKSSGNKLLQIQVLNGITMCKLKCTTYIHPAIKKAH